MIFNTQLELNITIKDINAIYSIEYEQMLLDHAKIMYEGQCRDGQYIQSITAVAKRSLPNLIRRDLDAKIRVYVLVDATVIRYDQYDIITGMKVHKVIPAGKINNFSLLECRNDHVVALMRLKTNIDEFKVGDIIPIRVGQSMYKIGNNHILINGYPFVPYAPERVYYRLTKTSKEIDQYFEKTVAPLVSRELTRKEQLPQATWDKFSKMLHPYKSVETESKIVGLTDLTALDGGVVSVNHKMDMAQMKLSTVSPKASESAIIVSEDHKLTLMRIGFQFVKWLEVVNDLTEQYGTTEDFDNVGYVWKLYESHKL